MLISTVQSQLRVSKKASQFAFSGFPFTSELQQENLIGHCVYFKSHCLFNEMRNLLDFYCQVFVLSVDHSRTMVLLLDAKEGREKKKCILPDNA